MRARSPVTARLSLAGFTVLVACASRKPGAVDSAAVAHAATPPAAPAAADPSAAPAASRPGDVAITTPDHGITLALANDSIWMGLSDSVRAQVRAATDSARMNAEHAGGVGGSFGAMIARTVTSAVNSGLGMRVSYPLADIQDVRYADGSIQFTYRPGAKHKLSFEDVNTEHHDGLNGAKEKRPILATFAPADAERFVAAVRARSGGRMTFPPNPATRP